MNKKTPQTKKKNLPAKPLAISNNELIRQQITSEVTIRNLDDVEPIKQALRYVFVLIGLRPEQIPDDVQKAVLLDYIKENLKNYTPEEIKIAFKMAVNGDFNADLNHFGLFSPAYFRKIFNGYLEHRNKIATEVSKEREKQARIEEEERLRNDPKQQEKIRKEFDEVVLRPAFESFKETKRLDFGTVPTEFVYRDLKKRGLIVLSKEEQSEIEQEAKKRTAGDVNHFKMRFSADKKENELRKLLRDPATVDKTSKGIFFENCFKIAIERTFSKFKTFNDVSL